MLKLGREDVRGREFRISDFEYRIFRPFGVLPRVVLSRSRERGVMYE